MGYREKSALAVELELSRSTAGDGWGTEENEDAQLLFLSPSVPRNRFRHRPLPSYAGMPRTLKCMPRIFYLL